MPNYNEHSVSGEYYEYQRSNKVIIMNELDSVPEITFMEQVIATLPTGEKMNMRKTKCVDTLSNPLEEFNLLHPFDDTIIGTSKYQDVYVLLYSLYRHVADKRDNPIYAPDTPVEPPV